jgi:transmembrane sensor
MNLDKGTRLRTAERAAHWLVAFRSGDLSGPERTAFIDWLRESPLHVSEMLHACRVHRDLTGFGGWKRILPFTKDAASQVVDLLPRIVNQPPPSRCPRRAGMAIAACLLSAAILAPFAISWLSESTWQTQLGERREVTLGDGSVVSLAPMSRIRVRYERNQRLISLVRGEALFHVAKDANRPFIVQAARARVRAVGTVFNVERSDNGVSITVVEGRVAVTDQQERRAMTAGANAGGKRVSLGADEQLVVSANGQMNPVRKVRGSAEIGWATGQLEFDNEPIRDIVRRFNGYNKVQIQVTDSALADRRVGGIFSARDPESFVSFVAAAGGVAVSRPQPNLIILGGQTLPADGGEHR